MCLLFSAIVGCTPLGQIDEYSRDASATYHWTAETTDATFNISSLISTTKSPIIRIVKTNTRLDLEMALSAANGKPNDIFILPTKS